jgi:hypothetical protein
VRENAKNNTPSIVIETDHPHPAFGHLLPEGEGIKRDALG